MKVRILFVDDEAGVLASIRRMLFDKAADWDMQFVDSSSRAQSLITQQPFDAVVLDVNLPGKAGLELLKEWKGGELKHDFEVIMLTGLEDEGLKRRALELGATDLLNKPVSKEDLVARLESVLKMKSYRDSLMKQTEELTQANRLLKEEIELRKRIEEKLNKAHRRLRMKNEQLREASVHDQLTRIFNRRFFDQKLIEYSRLSERFGQPLGCIISDLDHFKRVNDAHGHQVGDYVLKSVAALLAGEIRRTDIIARYGGEEFVVLLPNTPLGSAVEVAEKQRMAVENAELDYQGLQLRIAVSMGVAVGCDDSTLGENLVNRADDALYQAKRSGRNRVCQAQTTSNP